MDKQDLNQFSNQDINNILKVFKEYDKKYYLKVNKLVKLVLVYQFETYYPRQSLVDLWHEEGVSLQSK